MSLQAKFHAIMAQVVATAASLPLKRERYSWRFSTESGVANILHGTRFVVSDIIVIVFGSMVKAGQLLPP